MLDIQFTYADDEIDEFGSITEHIVVNGIKDEKSFFFDEEYKKAHFEDETVINILLDSTFEEIGKHFAQIAFSRKSKVWQDGIFIEAVCNNNYLDTFPAVNINFIVEGLTWAKAWSISSFSKEFEKTILSMEDKNLTYFQESHYSILDGFGIIFRTAKSESTIRSIVNESVPIFEKAAEITIKRLISNLDKDAILTYFQFPEEIKTACKQYLVYFSQFLQDMGIFTDTEIKDEAGQTLFKIVPQNKDQALSKIQEALNLYLNAPNNVDFFSNTSLQSDISVKQWEANVYHLKSQLTLANSILQVNQATIESLQLSNYQYKQLLESKKNSQDDQEDIIKNIVSVKKYEGNGFSINFAEILRKLKRKYS
jgi:hypothetical protein